MESMPSADRASDEPMFPTSRAFLVQFPRDVDPSGSGVRGRIEHITTGRSKRFATADDLFAFVLEVMNGGDEP